MVDPVQKVGDVAIKARLVLLGAAPDTVPSEPPYSVRQGHQRAPAVTLGGRGLKSQLLSPRHTKNKIGL